MAQQSAIVACRARRREMPFLPSFCDGGRRRTRETPACEGKPRNLGAPPSRHGEQLSPPPSMFLQLPGTGGLRRGSFGRARLVSVRCRHTGFANWAVLLLFDFYRRNWNGSVSWGHETRSQAVRASVCLAKRIGRPNPGAPSPGFGRFLKAEPAEGEPERLSARNGRSLTSHRSGRGLGHTLAGLAGR